MRGGYSADVGKSLATYPEWDHSIGRSESLWSSESYKLRLFGYGCFMMFPNPVSFFCLLSIYHEKLLNLFLECRTSRKLTKKYQSLTARHAKRALAYPKQRSPLPWFPSWCWCPYSAVPCAACAAACVGAANVGKTGRVADLPGDRHEDRHEDLPEDLPDLQGWLLPELAKVKVKSCNKKRKLQKNKLQV